MQNFLPHEYSTIVFDISHLTAANLFMDLFIAFVGSIGATQVGGPIVGAVTLIILTVGGIVFDCFEVRRVSLEHPLASGGTSYKVYETLDYSNHLRYDVDDRIKNAEASYYFDWRFGTSSDDLFAIKITATVQWAKWTGSTWEILDDYQTELSIIISIADYWQ